MELRRYNYNTFCRVIVQLKTIVTRFATEKYTNALGISPLSLKVAETNNTILMRGEALPEF